MTPFSPCMEHSNVGSTLSQHAPHGVLIVNKPDGWTSHDVVSRVRTILGIQKVGHAGTLDPHATGVLPVLIGKGTKIAQYLLDWDKEYAAVLQLGQTTDTQDAWGTVLEEGSCELLSEDDVRSAFMGFQGPIQQVPPMYSAVKVGGQPLYKKARKGQTVERQAKTIQNKSNEWRLRRGFLPLDIDTKVSGGVKKLKIKRRRGTKNEEFIRLV